MVAMLQCRRNGRISTAFFYGALICIESPHKTSKCIHILSGDSGSFQTTTKYENVDLNNATKSMVEVFFGGFLVIWIKISQINRL